MTMVGDFHPPACINRVERARSAHVLIKYGYYPEPPYELARGSLEAALVALPRSLAASIGEPEGGSPLLLILGGVAVAALLVVLLSGGDDTPVVTTGTLTISNRTSTTVSVEIGDVPRGTIQANQSNSYELTPGNYYVIIYSSIAATALTSSFTDNIIICG